MSVLLFLNFPSWVAGKSDFKESPVISPDLDLDFDFDLGFVKTENNENNFS